MAESKEEQPRSKLETHFQSIAMTFLIGAVSFSASYILKTTEESAAVKIQLVELNQKVGELKGIVQTLQLTTATRQDYKDLETRIREIEKERK